MFKHRKAWLSALLQMVAPGLGALYSGSPGRALLTAGMSLVVGGVGLGLVWSGKNGLLAALTGATVFFGFLVVDALRSARRANAAARPLTSWNRWYVYVLYFLAVIVGSEVMSAAGTKYILKGWRVPSAAMAPTIRPGDHLFADMLRFAPARGDMVLLRISAEPTYYVKRVLGLPGDTVRVRDGRVEIDGIAARAVSEGTYRLNGISESAGYSVWKESVDDKTYRIILADTGAGSPLRDWGPQTVPEGMVLVLGDNRDESNDTRSWGFIPAAYISGKPKYLYWPPARFGLRFGLDDEVK